MSKTKHEKHDHKVHTEAGVAEASSWGKMKTKEYEPRCASSKVTRGHAGAGQGHRRQGLHRVRGRRLRRQGRHDKRITDGTSPRVFKHIALPAPDARVKSQMYIQRYMAHFPSAGEVVIFDRSWYNRAGVEPVLGYCTRRIPALPRDGAAGREGDGRRRDHPDQILPQRQPRRADPAARGPDRRSAQVLEAVATDLNLNTTGTTTWARDKCSPPQARVGAVARRQQRQQEARTAQHHQPPAQPDPLQAARSSGREDAQAAERRRVLRAGLVARQHPTAF